MKVFLITLIVLIGLSCVFTEITPNFPPPQPIGLDGSTPGYDYTPSDYGYEFEDKTIIDAFLVSSPPLILTIPAGGAPPAVSVDQFVEDTSVLGGERDMTVTAVDGPPNALIVGSVTGEQFTIATPNSAEGSVLLQYDGLDNSPTLNSTGLGGLDLTFNNAFAFRFRYETDIATTFTITVYDGSGSASFTQTVPAGNVPQDEVIPYSDFSGSVDFTNVGAIEFFVNAFANVDFVLDTFVTFGEIGVYVPGVNEVCGSVLPCDADYYRLETLTDVQVNDYLFIQFNQTSAFITNDDDDFGVPRATFFIVGSEFDNLENELLTNNNIVDTLGGLPGPDNFLYMCSDSECNIEINCQLENTTYYIGVYGCEDGIVDYCFDLGFREVPVEEISTAAVPVFSARRPDNPPIDRTVHYRYYSIDIPESDFAEGTYLTVNLTRTNQPLTLRLMYGDLPIPSTDTGVWDTTDDTDSNGNPLEPCIWQTCVDVAKGPGENFYTHPVSTDPRIPCECTTSLLPDAPILSCNLTVDPCLFQYGTWYISVELPARAEPYDYLDTTGFVDYTLRAVINAPTVTTLPRNTTFKGFVEPERTTHYKIVVPEDDVELGESHLFVQISNIRGGFVDTWIHQGLGTGFNLAGGPEGCVPANATCRSCDACNLVIEKCHFVPGTWYIAVSVSIDDIATGQYSQFVDDVDRLPITYTIRANWLEDPTPTRLLAGVPVTSFIGEALYDFYVVDVPPTIDTWLFVELYTKAEDTEVILSMLHGSLPGGECYSRPDFYCLTGDTHTTKISTGPPQNLVNEPLSRESCSFMIQTCELEAGPLFLSVYGHHIDYETYGDNTFYQIPVHYTLYVDFDVALSLENKVSYSETVHEGQYQHYYIRADNVDQGSYMSVEVTNIQHGIPQTLEVFVNYNYLAGNCPCYDHLYNCTGAVQPSCGGSIPNAEPNFLPDPDSVATCCTIVVPRCDFRSGVWYISVLGVNEDLVQYTTPIGYTLTATVFDAPLFQPLILGQNLADTVPQWNRTNEYTHYQLAAAAMPLQDLVIQLTYVQNCEFLEKHDNLRDTLTLFVNFDAPAGSSCWDYKCDANIFGHSTCTVVIPHCEWVSGDYFIAVQGNYDAVFDGRYTLRASTYEVRTQTLTDGVPHYDRVPEGRYQHYSIFVNGEEDQNLDIALFTNSDQDSVSAYMNYEARAGASPCFDALRSCEVEYSCYWQLQACDIQKGYYYISVHGDGHQFYDTSVEYTLTATLSDTTVQLLNGNPITGHIREGEIQHYELRLESVREGDFLLFEIDSLKHGSVIVYENYGTLAGKCPCYLHEQTCTADSEGSRWCEIRVPSCNILPGSYFFSVVGVEQKSPDCLLPTPIGYTIEANVISPTFVTPFVELGFTQDIDNTELNQNVGNERYVHYVFETDEEDFELGYHIIVNITNVDFGMLFVYYNDDTPADSFRECHRAQICPGLTAGATCQWQLPYCLTKPGQHFITIEGVTGRISASYDINIWKQDVPAIFENQHFSLENVTSSFDFPVGAEYNATHNASWEPNNWSQFIRLEDVPAHLDEDRGEILELYFYRINNNIGQPTAFEVYLHPNVPAGKHDCCGDIPSDIGSCFEAPCSPTVETLTSTDSITFTPSHICDLGTGAGEQPVDDLDGFYPSDPFHPTINVDGTDAYRCTVRVPACEFNKYCTDEVDWFVNVYPVTGSDPTAQPLDGLTYSVQWRVRDTRLDQFGSVNSIDLTPLINFDGYVSGDLSGFSQTYNIFTETYEDDGWLSFFVDHVVNDDIDEHSRLVIQTSFDDATPATVYINDGQHAGETVPTSVCNEYQCSNGEDCAGNDRFIVSACCSETQRWFISVRNDGGRDTTAQVSFRISQIIEPALVTIDTHPSEDDQFITNADIVPGTTIQGVEGENYNHYSLTIDDADIDDVTFLIIEFSRNNTQAGELDFFFYMGNEGGDYFGTARDKYDDEDGCHSYLYTCSVEDSTDLCFFQIPYYHLIQGHWYYSVYNPNFDFDNSDIYPDYELRTYFQETPKTLLLNTTYTRDPLIDDYDFIVDGFYRTFRFDVTPEDIEYDDRSVLEGYYTNWLRVELGNIGSTSGDIDMFIRYDDLAGDTDVWCQMNNFDSRLSCSNSGDCFIDVFPCSGFGSTDQTNDFKLITGTYHISLRGSPGTTYDLNARILTESYEQILLTETITNTAGHRTGTTDLLWQHTVRSDELIVDGDGLGNYRYVIDITGEIDDDIADNEYLYANLTLADGQTVTSGINMFMFRDDCNQYECDVQVENGWCTVDALQLAPCTAKGGRYYFRIENPAAQNFTLSLYRNETLIQDIAEDQIITEIVYPYEYQEYYFEASDVGEGATLAVTIEAICGSLEMYIRPDLPAGPGPANNGDFDGASNGCQLDYCSVSALSEYKLQDDDDNSCTIYLDDCVYNQQGYYIGVRGVDTSFPSAGNDNLYLPIKYDLVAHQTNINFTSIYPGCTDVVEYSVDQPTVPQQFTLDIETVHVGSTLRFSFRVPTNNENCITYNSVPATFSMMRNRVVGYSSDCPNSEYTCTINPGESTCSWTIPQCATQNGRYYIWADAPRGTEVLVEQFDPWFPHIENNVDIYATVNGPAGSTEWNLPYRPERQCYEFELDPANPWDKNGSKFFSRVIVDNIEQGTINVSVNSGNVPIVDDNDQCPTPHYINNLSCLNRNEDNECVIDIQRSELMNGVEHDYQIPRKYWVCIEGVQQTCDLHSIQYRLRVQDQFVLTRFPADKTICNVVNDGEYNFHRLSPQATINGAGVDNLISIPQETILRVSISDVDVTNGERVSLLINDGALATQDGSDISVDTSLTTGSVEVDYVCRYDNLYMSVYGAATINDSPIDYLMNVTLVDVRVHELFNNQVYYHDDDDDDACGSNPDYFAFTVRTRNPEASFVRATISSECPITAYLNKDGFAGEACHTAYCHSESGECDLYDFIDVENTDYYVTVISECEYYIFSHVRDDAIELRLGEVFRDTLEPREWQLYVLEVCEDWFEADDRLVVEIADVNGGDVTGYIDRQTNPGLVSSQSDDDEEAEFSISAIDSQTTQYGPGLAGYNYLLVDHCTLRGNKYHILIRAEQNSAYDDDDEFGDDEDDCEEVSYRLFPYLVDYEIDPEEVAVNTRITDAVDLYNVERINWPDALEYYKYYSIRPEQQAHDGDAFAQLRVANVQGGTVQLDAKCGHLATLNTAIVTGERTGLTHEQLENCPANQPYFSGTRPHTHQTILDDGALCRDYTCSTDDDDFNRSCSLWLPSCFWVTDYTFYALVTPLTQDFVDHEITYDLIIDEYQDFRLLQADEAIVESMTEDNWEYHFYATRQLHTESAVFRVNVFEGEGVTVTIRDSKCPEQATWSKSLYVDFDYTTRKWQGEIEIPTEVEHPGHHDDTHTIFYIDVYGKNATYAISYFTGLQNCHNFAGSGRNEGLDFCAGIVNYPTWRHENYVALDHEAECFFEELYQHFRVQPCWSGVTPECNSTLQRFACYESFRACDAHGFARGTCEKACNAVVYECVNHFESVDLEHYNCTSSRYIDENDATCTGSDEFESFIPNTDLFLSRDPDLILFSPSPSSSNASTLSISIIALIASLFIFFF